MTIIFNVHARVIVSPSHEAYEDAVVAHPHG
jgi:hypothetical protein